MDIFAVSMDTGVGIGLIGTALAFGFRHGIDWDHLAALTDITGSQDHPRGSMFMATLYALGHASVVFVLGVVAIALSAEVPAWLDSAVGRVVGVTLLVLGVYVLVGLVRHGRDFRMRSRWMLVFAGVKRGARWVRNRRARDLEVIVHDHDHAHGDGHDHAHEIVSEREREVAAVAVATRHRHVHTHTGSMPDDPFPSYGRRTAFGIGMLHGIGAETPTQVLVFAAAAGASGALGGVVVLVAFLVGLLASNTLVAVAATSGFLGAARSFPVYATISVVTAVFSLVVGTLFLLDLSAGLPAIFSG
jgi:high-affinity nickel-transport protein